MVWCSGSELRSTVVLAVHYCAMFPRQEIRKTSTINFKNWSWIITLALAEKAQKYSEYVTFQAEHNGG